MENISRSVRSACVAVAHSGILASRAETSAAVANEHSKTISDLYDNVERLFLPSSSDDEERATKAVSALIKATSILTMIRHFCSEITDSIRIVSQLSLRATTEHAEGIEQVTEKTLYALRELLSKCKESEMSAAKNANGIQTFVNSYVKFMPYARPTTP